MHSAASSGGGIGEGRRADSPGVLSEVGIGESEGLNVVCDLKACRGSKSSWRCRSKWDSAVAVRCSR